MNFLKAANIKNKIIILYQKRLNINFKGFFFQAEGTKSPICVRTSIHFCIFFFYTQRKMFRLKSHLEL